LKLNQLYKYLWWNHSVLVQNGQKLYKVVLPGQTLVARNWMFDTFGKAVTTTTGICKMFVHAHALIHKSPTSLAKYPLFLNLVISAKSHVFACADFDC